MLWPRACLLIFALTASISASSQPSTKGALVGLGVSSCGVYLDFRNPRSEQLDTALASWISGFISGMNNSRFKLTKAYPKLLPDGPSVLAYMDKYCRENPLKAIWQGADALFEEL